MGLLNPFLYYIVLFKAYDLLPAQQAQPLNYTWALTLTILSVPMLGQRLTKIDSLACCLGYTGALIIATGGNIMTLNFQKSARGYSRVNQHPAMGPLLDIQHPQQ